MFLKNKNPTTSFVMRGALSVSMFPFTSLLNECCCVWKIRFFVGSTGAQSDLGDSRASNVGVGIRASLRLDKDFDEHELGDATRPS